MMRTTDGNGVVLDVRQVIAELREEALVTATLLAAARAALRGQRITPRARRLLEEAQRTAERTRDMARGADTALAVAVAARDTTGLGGQA